MADSVVGFLLENLSRLLEDELKLFSGVEDKINSLRSELRFIDIFLKSSEGKRSDEVVKEVVSQIRDVAHKAEDVVDTYVATITKHKRRNILSKLFHFKERLMVSHEVSAEIEKIKSRIDEIYNKNERYGIGQGDFQSEEAAAAESLRKRRRDVEEEDVVGLVHDSTVVIKQLKESASRLEVVSIIGMGGLGKTTLARKIYNNREVKELFPCRAWGYVSNDYRPNELLQSLLKFLLPTSEYDDLLKKIIDEGKELSEGELKMKVGECLKGKKYLVVLDDIWKTQVWDEVRGAFPDDQNGSRILITSRMNEMAHYTGTMPPYHLPFLNKQESWELFSKKVFRGEECPSDLEPLGRSIVETCRGLPLAIVVLAGLVAKKEKSQREWLRIEEISWHLTQDKTEVMNILKLSYDSLPPRLKPCFLYFGIYPEDYEINARQLIKLWIAEGFIQPQETGIPNTTEPEDVADYFLDELVDRSLVQVAKRRSDGGVKTCRIHDLLLDLCISESRSGKFLEVCTEFNIDTLSNTNPRRLSLHCQPHYDTFALGKSCTRSFFIYSGKCPEYIQKSFKLARVLHFERETFSSLDSNLKRMIHLRYLKISGMYNFLASISCLWNLETLDLRAYKGIISREIWKLKRLRHLYLRGFLNFPEAKGERMENLQTLSIRGVEQNMIFMLNNDSFPRLRKLTLDKSKELRSLHQLSTLQSLKITLNSVDLPLASYSTAFPSHLTKITVKLGQSPEADSYFFTKTLGWLTNLQVLKLQQIEPIFPQSPLELHTGTGEFPQLQVFYMRGIFIRGWTLEEGAMPSLRHLVIDTCHHLRELPEQLWSLTTLQLVHVVKPYRDLAPSLENVELKNGCKLIIEK